MHQLTTKVNVKKKNWTLKKKRKNGNMIGMNSLVFACESDCEYEPWISI